MRERVVVFACIGIAAACASRPRRAAESEEPWPIARAAAATEAAAGRFAAADSVLTAFGTAFPASADTVEALFWRAVYIVDPANESAAGPNAALPLLDRYLSGPVAPDRRYEAELLRRIAILRATPPEVRVDTVVKVDTSAARAAVTREFEARDRVREEELVGLRDSLARTVAELERIRRRVAPPRP